MKKAFIIIVAACAIAAVCSCNANHGESQFKEFDISCSDGTTRQGGVYIPKKTRHDDRLPVIYMADGLVFKDCNFKHMIDSLIDNHLINPVVVACSYENKRTIPGYRIAYRNAEYIEEVSKQDNKLAAIYESHMIYFCSEFIPYIQKNAPVSANREDMLFFGTSNSADFGLTLSMRNPELIQEYWCYSPVFSNVRDYPVLEQKNIYRICWGAKEEVEMFSYFPSLLNDLRKRGGTVHSWTYNGGHEREWWKYWFEEELQKRFPYSSK